MGLKLLRDAKGHIRPIWYGRLTRNGRKVDVRLDTPPVKGKIPLTPNGTWDKQAKGDAAFEKSREAAQAAFKDLIDVDKRKRLKVQQLEAQLLAVQGRERSKTPLTSLYAKWRALKGENNTNNGFAERSFSSFASFADSYTRNHGGICRKLEEVSPELAQAFYRKLVDTYSWGYACDIFYLLKGAWKRWSTVRTMPNPFESVEIKRDKDTPKQISRIPLTSEEVKRLFAITKERAPDLYPLVACVATTGLRISDASTLKWDEIVTQKDIARRNNGDFGYIDRTTTKTKARVIVPIIQPFADVLADMEAKHADNDIYLFPKQAKQYSNPNARARLTKAIMPYIALAVKPELEEEATVKNIDGINTDGLTLDAVLAKIQAKDLTPNKKSKLQQVARECFAGMPLRTIAADLGYSYNMVNSYLDTIEDLTGVILRKCSKVPRGGSRMNKTALIEFTQRKRDKGIKKASVYGWHSLRATYVVLGVEAGVPLPYIERAVGHATLTQTMEYFNPTGKHAAAMIASRLGSTFAPAAIPLANSEVIDIDNLDANGATMQATVTQLTQAAQAQVTQAQAAQARREPQPLTAESVWDSLPEEEKRKLRRKLLEEAGII